MSERKDRTWTIKSLKDLTCFCTFNAGQSAKRGDQASAAAWHDQEDRINDIITDLEDNMR